MGRHNWRGSHESVRATGEERNQEGSWTSQVLLLLSGEESSLPWFTYRHESVVDLSCGGWWLITDDSRHDRRVSCLLDGLDLLGWAGPRCDGHPVRSVPHRR